MKTVDLIIFDLDGTLVDSQEAIVEGVNFSLRQVGRPEKSTPEIVSYIGSGVDALIRQALGPKHLSLFARTKSAMENYKRNSADGSVLFPGVKEVLRHFVDKFKAVVTNGQREFALRLLQNLKVDTYFAVVVGGDDTGCMKPAACPLDNIVSRLQVEKEKTIVVGDMDIDIIAGKKAGMATCAVTYGMGRKEDIVAARPDYIIEHIGQLKKIIN